MKRAIYSFSGDPITFGHIDIIRRAAATFDEVLVGIGSNPAKSYLFTVEERAEMARRSLRSLHNVKVLGFKGLLVDFAYEQNIAVIVKGVRNSADFDYENVLHQVGESQKLGIDTFILFARPGLAHVSSSAVKAMLKEQGLIHEYVPLYVKQCLEAKMLGQSVVGVTGEIGAGKSYVSALLAQTGRRLGIETHNIELDEIGHRILDRFDEPGYREIRKRTVERFGREVRDAGGMVNRRTLGRIVFNDPAALRDLNRILFNPIMVRLKREMYGKRGLIILNAALSAETGILHLCNNNVVLVHCAKEEQERRLLQRGLTKQQIRRRLASQYSFEEKRRIIGERIRLDGHGRMWVVDDSRSWSEGKAADLARSIGAYFGIGKGR